MSGRFTISAAVAFLLGLSIFRESHAANLLRNPGFETQGSGPSNAYYWTGGYPDEHGGYRGSASREDWRSFSGTWEGAIRGGWSGYTQGDVWQQSPATPGKRYRFTGWFWSDGWWNLWLPPDDQGIKLEFFNAATNFIEEHIYRFFDVGPNWVRKGIEAVAPTNAAWVRVVIYAENVEWDAALQFDDLELVELDISDELYPGPSSRRTGLVISEIMYHPTDRPDGKDLEFVELYNTTPFTNRLEGHRLSGSISYAFADNVVIPPFGYLVVAKERASVESVYGISGVLGPFDGRLPNSSGRVRLRKTPPAGGQEDAILLEVNYTDQPPWPLAADGAGHSLVLSEASCGEDNPRAWSASISLGGSPGGPEVPAASVYTNVVINEFLAHTDEPQWDYIELFNTSTQTIHIGGCWLSDTVSTNKFRIPDGTMIPGRGYKVYLSVTNPPNSSPTNLTFNLSSKGEDILFRAPDGEVVNAIRFEAQQNGVAVGRYPDGAADFHELASPTPGTANSALWIRPVVINELMYNPISGDDNDQYVELYNRSGSAVDVGNWRFVDGITYSIPSGTAIPAGGYLVVAKNALHLMSNYPGVLNSGNTIGDFGGNLSRSGERVALAKPDDPGLPEQDFVIVDEVTYHDGGQWGEWSDGGGSSLELIDSRSDNRQASNWADSDESAKSSWTLIQYTNVLDLGFREWWVEKVEGGITNYYHHSFNIDELHILMLRRGECLVDDVEVRLVIGGTEQGNLVANSTFEGGVGGWTFAGNHVSSGLATEGYGGSSQSLCLRASGGGDNGINRVKTGLTTSFSEGQSAVLRARARWLRGSPYYLMRLRGNYLEAEGPLPVPKNLGTPGQQNSRYAANTGPAIWDVSHYPVLPAAGERVQVTARVHDPDGVNAVRLRYRLDPSSTVVVSNMTHIGGGVYRTYIPAQPYGQLVAFHVWARDNYSPRATNTFPANATVRECLVRFGDVDTIGDLGSYRFWMTQANLDEWKNRERHSNEYLDTTFVSGGKRVIYNAGIRWRGSPWIRVGMSDPEVYEWRSAFRVKFPADDMYLGMDELNLDTLERDRDTTLQRERMCFQIAEQLGLPSSYQRYVFVYLNGIQYPYAYADVHHIERDYFRKWFPGEDDGELFKIDDWAEYRNFTDDFDNGGFDVRNATLENFTTTGGEKKKARYRWNLEKSANAGFDDDYAGLFRLVDAGNLSNDQYAVTLEAIADMQQWMRMFAFRHVIGDWDGYGYHRGKNTFMYRPNNGRWNMIPWDLDFGLGAGSHWPDHDLFDVADYLPVVKRMVEHPPFRRYYWQTLRAAAMGPLLSTRVNPVMDEIYNVLREQGVAAEHPWHPKNWVADRRDYILSQLPPVTNFSLTAACTGTNGNVVTLSGRAPIQIYTLTFNGVPYHVTWTTVTNWTMTMAIPSGASTIEVTGYDETGAQVGSSVSLNVNYSGSDVDPQDNVIINEIMYHPSDELAEFLELHNRHASYAFDLTGYRMAGVDYVFEQGAVIPPGGYLLLVESVPSFAAVHTNLSVVAGAYSGKLENSGERLRLMRPVGVDEEVVDTVVYNRLAPWPGEADGQGPSLQLIDGRRDRNRVSNWGVDPVALYTPGASNSISRDLPEFPRVWINELQSSNTSTIADNNGEYDPWLELFNGEVSNRDLTHFFLTDDFGNLRKWQFPSGAFAPAEWFRLVWMDGQTAQTAGTNYHASFRLNAGTNGSVALVYSNAGEVVIVDYVHYTEIPEDKSYGSYPDGDTFARLLLRTATPGEPNTPLTMASLVELLVPRVIQGEQDADGENFNRVPYAFRARVEGLLPEHTYRYANRVVTESDAWDQDGAGNMIMIHTNGETFVRTTSGPRFRPGDLYTRHGVFTTDHTGSFEGWFITEPSGNARFTPGNTLHMRILLNDGIGGEEIEHYLTTTNAVRVRSFGTGATNVSGLVGYSHAGPRQFVVLYDDEFGAARPVSIAFVEVSGAVADYRYADFYIDEVYNQAGRWGTIIPNNSALGVRRVEEHGLTDGVVRNVMYEDDVGWPGTVNPTGGLTPLILNAPPRIDPMADVTIGPGSLLMLQASGTDPDAPPQVLSFTLVEPAPTGAAIGEYSGVFTWAPPDGYASSTNLIIVRVRDDGSPRLGATGTLTVIVAGMDQVFESDVLPTTGGSNFVIRWNAEIGTTYRVEAASEIMWPEWSVLSGDVLATGSVAHKEDTNTYGGMRFYRVLRLLP